MNRRLKKLSDRIQIELNDIQVALNRAITAWREFCQTNNDLYLDSVALNLHSFYNGLERIFESIAETIDGRRPEGKNWHKALLEQMGAEISNVRPAVFSEQVCSDLDEFCRFRHVIRHIYGHKLIPAQLGELIAKAPNLLAQINTELAHFTNWLTQF